ncbi:hypothetical protein IH992_07880 [Candidatus Poribacteria bacterium]|nr:hypothetical protein [Candidatus Poribacteria bacterium]
MLSKRRYRIQMLIIILLTLSGSIIVVCHVGFPSTSLSTGSSMSETFESDIADMVYEWNPQDPRSEKERQRALFGFMTETYNGSFFIPNSLLQGNFITQAVIGDRQTIARDKVGLVFWPENQTTQVYGVSPNVKSGEPIGFTSNCVMCHLAEIDGKIYFGAGNKLFDEKVLVDSLTKLTSSLGRVLLSPDSDDYKMAVKANAVLTARRYDKTDPLTRGRSTAFAGSHVEFYLRLHGGMLPNPTEVGRGDTKIPPLWHFAAKAPFERWYVDGSFRGEIPLMASSMELFKGRSFEELDEFVIPAIKREFLTVVSHIRPPKYPYEINETLAAKGKQLFYSKEIGCYRCHGVYDGKGNVQWTGKHVDVGTDAGRIDVVSEGFIDTFSKSPLSKHGQLGKSEGYAATPLTGVWANYPYLHNGSVPTLYHLLGPELERPEIFNVMAARQFDPQRVGQKLDLDASHERLNEAALLLKFGNDRDWFNVNRPGYRKTGHDFWSRIKTDENRMALIEYLKTL